MNLRWYAVRCCCQPQKVLGFIRLPESGPMRITVRETPAAYKSSFNDNVMDHDVRLSLMTRHEIELKLLATVNNGNELAVYSDDRPIEFWRKIVGFVEAKQ